MAEIGIDIERTTLEKAHDLRLIDRIGDQSSPAWYLDQMSCTVSPICSSDATIRFGTARRATDIATRAALLAEAEASCRPCATSSPSPIRFDGRLREKACWVMRQMVAVGTCCKIWVANRHKG